MTYRRNLKRTAALALPALAIMCDATAQEASGNADANIDTVVVTGFRQSLRNAQNIKREAEQVVDSVVAEDIGKLPDNNLAEALQRIPGVQITRNRGEGSGIAVRGLTQVKTLLNGREIYSDTGRDLSLENVPAEILGGVDVYKNPSAYLIEGGLLSRRLSSPASPRWRFSTPPPSRLRPVPPDAAPPAPHPAPPDW